MVGYVRVSSGEQGASGLGLEAQRAAIRSYCAQHGYRLVAICEDVASGGSTNGRHGLAEAIAMCDRHEAAGLVAAKLDRLSRSVVDFGTLVERAKRKGWNLCVIDLGIDLASPMGEAMANMAVTFAQLERRLGSERTKAGLAVARANGTRLGAAVAITEPQRAMVLALRMTGLTQVGIAAALNLEGVASPKGGKWHATSVRRALAAA
jgi:DNA invertase Pin-like site-specific DNA recombinase